MAVRDVQSAAADAVPAVDRRHMLNAIVASCFGWALDLFDLFILLYVAPVIGAAFFPSERPTLSLAAIYASFSVMLLMRPLGSAVFAIGGMMPTFVSLASPTPADLPVSLSVFVCAAFLIYLIGALIIPETKGRFT